MLTESFVISQDLDLGQEHQEFNLLQNLNFGFQVTVSFFSLYLFSSFFIYFLNFMNKVITKRAVGEPKCTLKQSVKQIASSCLNITDQVYNISPSIGVFILILELYLWLFMLMVVNTTKTNKVVIDTSKIIKNVDDALITESTFCLLEDDTELKVCRSKN